MTDNPELTNTTKPDHKAEPVKSTLAGGEPKPFTGVWEDLTHGNYTQMLTDIKTEAEAAIASGDMALQKWARSTGTFASVLLNLLQNTDPAQFNGPKKNGGKKA